MDNYYEIMIAVLFVSAWVAVTVGAAYFFVGVIKGLWTGLMCFLLWVVASFVFTIWALVEVIK